MRSCEVINLKDRKSSQIQVLKMCANIDKKKLNIEEENISWYKSWYFKSIDRIGRSAIYLNVNI